MSKLASTSETHPHHEHDPGPARAGYFLGHLGEMTLAITVGMVAGGAVLVLIFTTVKK
ncbi:MAG TPA: hypothetical protein VMW65_13370 [Chloroflexota bacterium]|nr:hypothetical protein [Chloroflexota bacterium]